MKIDQTSCASALPSLSLDEKGMRLDLSLAAWFPFASFVAIGALRWFVVACKFAWGMVGDGGRKRRWEDDSDWTRNNGGSI